MNNIILKKVRFGDKVFYPRIQASYIDPRDINVPALPTGRISVDDQVTFASLIKEMATELSIANPKFPLEYLDVMQNLSLVNPDISQMVDNIVQLGNTGHKIVITTATDAQKEKILEELNTMSMSAFKKFGGVHGFSNSLFGQIARGGAGSVEWVVSDDLDGIDYSVFVPISTVKFVRSKENQEYLPYQKVSDISVGDGGLVPLNVNTYQYCAMSLLDNSPYAVPPILSALEPIMIQRDIIKNFKFVAKKMGLLGFVTFLLKQPTQGSKTTSQYLEYCREFLSDQAEQIKNNYRDGMAIGFMDNFKVEHHTLMGNAQGATEIMKEIEQQVFSGLKADPAMHGRTYSTTETYAGVVYEKMLSMLTNYQATVKKILEYGYKLHLTLKGIDYEDLYIEFEPSKSLSYERDEAAYGTKLQNLQLLYEQGIISQDQFAQEAGYDNPELPEPRGFGDLFAPDNAPADTNSNKLSFKFNTSSGEYILIPRPLTRKLNGDAVPLEEAGSDDFLEKAWEQLYAEYYDGCSCSKNLTDSFIVNNAAVRRLKQFINQYFRTTFPSVKGSRQKAIREVEQVLNNIDPSTMDSEQFSELVYSRLESAFATALDLSPLSDQIRKNVNRFYSFYRLKDKDPFDGDFPVKPSFHTVDKEAIKFIKGSDDFYFGKFLSDKNTKKSLKNWLTDDFLRSGRSLRDPGQLDEFKKRFGDRVAQEDYKVLRVVETSVSRAKNWGNALNVEQSKATLIKIAGPNDNVVCPWCRGMLDKEFKVRPVVQNIKDTVSKSPEDLPQLSPFLTGRVHPEALKETSSEQLLAQGIALPPYHPHCRHTFVVTEFDE